MPTKQPATAPTSLALSAIEERALRLLLAQPDLVRPGYFGTLLWPETRRPTWAFARPAGNVLNRLRKAGLVTWESREGRDKRWGWRLTDSGRTRAMQLSSIDDSPLARG